MKLDTSFDFGFSIVSEEELKAAELAQLQKQQAQTEQLKTQVQTNAEMENKLLTLRSMVMPLLMKLKESPEKNYVFWPDREAKLNAFIAKINTLVDSK